MRLRILSTFSGIGAHDLGFEWAGHKIVGQIEIDEYCQKVLAHHWPDVPKWRDICNVTASDLRDRCGRIDLITGGFPCQDISTAGKQAGIIEGNRSSLYWELWRLIRDIRPTLIVLENVPALRTKGADNVFASLESLGYALWSGVVGAVHAGAPHIRKRVVIVGYRPRSRSKRRAMATRSERKCLPDFDGSVETGRDLERAITVSPQPESDGLFLEHTEGARRTQGGVSSRDEEKKPRSANTSSKVLSDADRERLRKQSEPPRRESPSFAFPLGPGFAQHDWEQPRLVSLESEVGGSATRASLRLARSRINEQTKGLGNANPPQTFYLIGLALKEWMKSERTRTSGD